MTLLAMCFGTWQNKAMILTRPRNIDFTVVFADESSAHQFARHFRVLGHDVSVEKAETDKRFPWDVVVVQRMIPSRDGISSFEDLLQTVASGWGGHNCGCGCFPELWLANY